MDIQINRNSETPIYLQIKKSIKKLIVNREFSFNKRFFPLEKMMKYNFNNKEKLFLDIFSDSADKNYISLGGITMDFDMIPTDGMKEIVRSMFSGKMGSVLHTLSRNEGGGTRENICNILSKENMYVNPRNIQLQKLQGSMIFH